MGRPSENSKGENIMATIGTFTKLENGGFKGQIHTLTFKADVVFEPAEKRSDNSPDFRIIAGKAEPGAAWTKHSNTSGSTYQSVTLDDPSFPAPINARLVESASDGKYILIWERKRD
jgi:uncharacterized protein (DUF736 family)